jgi:hypothetical protein
MLEGSSNADRRAVAGAHPRNKIFVCFSFCFASPSPRVALLSDFRTSGVDSVFIAESIRQLFDLEGSLSSRAQTMIAQERIASARQFGNDALAKTLIQPELTRR